VREKPTGPATKITNLGALKIVLGLKNFVFYLLFVIVFSLVSGVAVNICLNIFAARTKYLTGMKSFRFVLLYKAKIFSDKEYL